MGQDDQNNDPELIAKIKDRDPEAMALFIQQNRPRLLGFIRSISGDHLLGVTELDDILQDVSATAISSLNTAPLDQYEPIQWLQQLARRRVVDTHRFHFDAKQRDANRQQSIHGDSSKDDSGRGMEALLVASMTSPSAVVSRDNRMMRMAQAIETLGEDQRTAIRLRYAEGLSTKEVAKQIGKTDVATRVLLSRCMRELEKLLADVKPTR